MSERIVFLDFDGVLVTRKSLYALKQLARGMEGRPSQEFAVDPDCVAPLNFITDAFAPNARIVISSTWRLHDGLADLRGLLKSWGVTAPVIAKTPRLPDADRGDEIQRWLDTYPRDVESFVILDDDSDMGALMPHLVQTSMDGGLTMEHARQAIAILGTTLAATA